MVDLNEGRVMKETEDTEGTGDSQLQSYPSS